jgi:hypothetical protein
MLPFAAAAAAMVLNAKHAEARNERHLHAGLAVALGSLFFALTPVMLLFVAPWAAYACLVVTAAAVWAFHGEQTTSRTHGGGWCLKTILLLARGGVLQRTQSEPRPPDLVSFLVGPFMSWPSAFLKGPEAAAGFAAMNCLGSLGGVLGPSLLGFLRDRFGSYAASMGVLSGLLAFAATGIMLFPVQAEREPVVNALGDEDIWAGSELMGSGKEEIAETEQRPFLR